MGSALVVLGLVGMLGAGIGTVLWFEHKARRRLEELLRGVSQRYCGVLVPGDAGRAPRLEFDVDGTPVTLTVEMHARAVQATQLHFSFAPPGILRVAPEGFLSRLGSFLGRSDIQVDDPEFDRKFEVHGQPVEWVREVLEPKVRELVRIMLDLGDPGLPDRLHVAAGPGGVDISVSGNLVYRPTLLNLFLENAIALFRRIRQTADGRVCLPSALRLAETGKCPVCAQEVGTDRHDCPTCDVPHHRECWEYAGGCGIYGCTSRAPIIRARERTGP